LVVYFASGITVIGPCEGAQKEAHGSTIDRHIKTLVPSSRAFRIPIAIPTVAFVRIAIGG
jgi:hypothetical protein